MPKISTIDVVSPVPPGTILLGTNRQDGNKTINIEADDILNAGGGRVLIHTPAEDGNTIQDDTLIGAQSIYKIEESNICHTDPENDTAFPGFALDNETGTITITQNYFYANTKYIIYIIP